MLQTQEPRKKSLRSLLLRHQPPLLQDLQPQPLSGQLDVKNRADTALPRLLQPKQLTLPSLLRELPLLINRFDLLLSLSQFPLQSSQDILQLRIPNQPRILPILLQQRKVLVSCREVVAGGIGLAESLAPLVEIGGAV